MIKIIFLHYIIYIAQKKNKKINLFLKKGLTFFFDCDRIKTVEKAANARQSPQRGAYGGMVADRKADAT